MLRASENIYTCIGNHETLANVTCIKLQLFPGSLAEATEPGLQLRQKSKKCARKAETQA
jgi:hypothetical protein